MSLFEALCKSQSKVFQYLVPTICNALSQKWSWCHSWCAKFQILSILCLSLLCANLVLQFSHLLEINGSLEVSSDFHGWIKWQSGCISWSDGNDLIGEHHDTIQQGTTNGTVYFPCIHRHFCHNLIWWLFDNITQHQKVIIHAIKSWRWSHENDIIPHIKLIFDFVSLNNGWAKIQPHFVGCFDVCNLISDPLVWLFLL